MHTEREIFSFQDILSTYIRMEKMPKGEEGRGWGGAGVQNGELVGWLVLANRRGMWRTCAGNTPDPA